MAVCEPMGTVNPRSFDVLRLRSGLPLLWQRFLHRRLLVDRPCRIPLRSTSVWTASPVLTSPLPRKPFACLLPTYAVLPALSNPLCRAIAFSSPASFSLVLDGKTISLGKRRPLPDEMTSTFSTPMAAEYYVCAALCPWISHLHPSNYQQAPGLPCLAGHRLAVPYIQWHMCCEWKSDLLRLFSTYIEPVNTTDPSRYKFSRIQTVARGLWIACCILIKGGWR